MHVQGNSIQNNDKKETKKSIRIKTKKKKKEILDVKVCVGF